MPQGCTWRDGEVTTPAGYREAYATFVEGGWAALACDPEDGGQGLPALLNAAFNEMIAAANHGWTMYPGLLHGAYGFLAPKILSDGTRNAIRCDGIEKKMGVKGSATCAMSFEGATGWVQMLKSMNRY